MKAAKKEVYSPCDIAQLCSKTAEEIFQWIEQKELSAFQIPGGHWRVRHETLERFLKERAIPAPTGWNGSFERFRIFVVEDDPDLLEIIVELLHEDSRFEVHQEDGGFNAGLRIPSLRPDLILLDFLMPGVNGFEVCQKLRRDPATQDIPVLGMTSLTRLENRQAVLDSGVSDLLGKPFASEVLFDKVKALLGLHAHHKV